MTDNKKKRVAIYTRVSTVEQAEEGFSLDEQERVLSDYCKAMGYEIHRVYSDKGISGKNISGRPDLKRLLSDAKDKKFDLLLVWKINRLARSILDLLKMIEDFEEYGVGFKSYSESFETETPSGKLSLHMMAAVGEFERGTIAQNVKMGMMARAKEGKWNGGKVLGYDIVEVPSEGKKRKETRLEANEKETETVRLIFELYSQGNGYKAIVNKINKEGHITKRGNMFSVSSIKGILTNPVYIGKIRYDMVRKSSGRKVENPNPLIVEGEHCAIIDTDIWDKTQILLEKRTGKPSRVYDSEYPLTGILKCPQCGAGMVISGSTKTNKDGVKKRITYYACGAWKNKGSSVCGSNLIRVKSANEKVFKKIRDIINKESILRQVVESINKKRIDNIKPMREKLIDLERQKDTLEAKKEKTFEAYEEGIISKAEFSERLSKLNEGKENRVEEITKLKIKLDNNSSEPIDFKMVMKIMKKFYEVFKDSATREQRKQLLHLIVEEITVDEDRNVDNIKIRLNSRIMKYLDPKRESEISRSDSLSFVSRKEYYGDIVLNVAV